MVQFILAGMRTVVLTDVARFRLQSLSFFLLVVLLLAWAVKGLWNYLGRDFSFLPRLNYPRALGVVLLWGMLFIIVLAMISGARELMTPGAWVKQPNGGYKLASGLADEPTRRAELEALRAALWAYADAHGEQFPPHEFDPAIPPDAWRVGTASSERFFYLPGRQRGQPLPLAREPEQFGEPRLVLLADGRIQAGTGAELAAAEAAR